MLIANFKMKGRKEERKEERKEGIKEKYIYEKRKNVRTGKKGW